MYRLLMSLLPLCCKAGFFFLCVCVGFLLFDLNCCAGSWIPLPLLAFPGELQRRAD
uniref:Uncharacterized protein n=1 Tax=Anguilla anguilla TaxID=7936 RepID=A0A0E9XMX3_ANGAN